MMPSDILPAVQDTTVVALAPDGLAAFAAWALGGVMLAFLVLVVAVLLVLAELRRLSAAWTDFLASTSSRSESLVASATSAARNIDQITATVRGEVGRLQTSVGGLAGGLEQASAQLQRRLKDLLALVDLAQSEAEEAVLETAARVRALRANAGGFLLAQLRRNLTGDAAEDGTRGEAGPAAEGLPETEEATGTDRSPAAEASQAAGGARVRETPGSGPTSP
ncbi:MAG: hypothetical protein OXI83_00595 [Gemmatimonadota bacterium]|nr:hypothetical protein [Gemmatimonadota bacterium]